MICGRQWWLKLSQHRHETKFPVAAGLSDIKLIGLAVFHCQNTPHQRDTSFQTFPSAKLISEAKNSTIGSLQWPRDSDVRPTKDQKTCLHTDRVLSSRSSEDPTGEGRLRALTFTPKYHGRRHTYVCSRNLGERQRTQPSAISSARQRRRSRRTCWFR